MIKKRRNIINMFIGSLVKSGHRLRAEKICLQVMRNVKYELKKNPFFVLESCVRRVRPVLTFKPKKVAGIIYKLPAVLKVQRSNVIAIKWLLNEAHARHEKDIVSKLTKEILEAYKGKSAVYKKRKELHRIALVNRAFLKFARKR